MMKKTLATLTAVAAMFVAGNAMALDQVGWNYYRAATPLDAGDSAGAPGFEQTNWNNHQGAGQDVGAVPLALNDDGGAPSGVSVTAWSVSAPNSWSYNDTGTPDQDLMNDFNDADPSVTFSGVNAFTPDGYTVVVYYGNNEFNFNGGADIDVNGSVQTILTNDNFTNTNGYVLNTDNGATGSNYAVFNNISGDTLTVAFDAVGNDGVSAIQIIAVPEPASIALLGLGGLMMLRRRKA